MDELVVQEQNVENYLGKDIRRFESLVKSKSRSRIRIDGRDKREPQHSDVIQYILEQYKESRKLAGLYVTKLKPDI